MTRYDTTARRTASAAAIAATAGLALTGCQISATSAGASSPSVSASSSAGSSRPAASGSSPAGARPIAFFPVGVGNTWVYASSLAGQPASDLTARMTAVDQAADGEHVTMAVAAGTAAPNRLAYVFHGDGSITVPLTQFGTRTAQLTSVGVVWPKPAELATGQPVTSTVVLTETVAGHVSHETARVTVRGAGRQAVTVPAGTYQAQVIDETFTVRVGTAPVSITTQTWVATGVGPVKSTLGSLGSIPATVEELKSFTRGQ